MQEIDWKTLTLPELRQYAIHSYRQGGGSRPDVLLLDVNGQKAVLKDQNQADRWFAFFIGPLLNWRETKALKKLASIDGIPELLAIPNKRAFLMSYRQSQPVTKVNPENVNWPAFFTELKALVNNVHQAGVTHNDLRNPTNILISDDGHPVLVDLVACFCLGRRWNIINRWLFTKFRRVDHSAISKLKHKVAPELIDENDLQAEQVAGKAGMAARSMGQMIRRISRKIFTK